MLLEVTDTSFNLIDNLAQFVILLATLAISQIMSAIRNRKPKQEMKLTLESLAADIGGIKSELKTNGGSSLKDVVNKIHAKQDQLDAKVESVIAQARGRTELALNQSGVAQFMCNELGEVTFANDALVDLVGIGRNHLMKNKWLVCIEDQDMREEVVRRLSFAIDKKIPFAMADIRLKNQKTGEVFTGKISIDPTLDAKDIFMWHLGKIKV